jgi:hypothetical protein
MIRELELAFLRKKKNSDSKNANRFLRIWNCTKPNHRYALSMQSAGSDHTRYLLNIR